MPVVRRRWRRAGSRVMSEAWWGSGGAVRVALSIRSVRSRGMSLPPAHEQLVVGLAGEGRLQGVQTACGLGLHGALGAAENGGDLGDREVVVVAQHQAGTLP